MPLVIWGGLWLPYHEWRREKFALTIFVSISRRSATRSTNAEMRELGGAGAALIRFVTPDSPTRAHRPRRPAAAFPTVRHRLPMLSLGNAFDKQELHAFRRAGEAAPGVCRPRKLSTTCANSKVDGLAVSLRYENGRLTTGLYPRRRILRRRHHQQHPHDTSDTATAA